MWPRLVSRSTYKDLLHVETSGRASLGSTRRSKTTKVLLERMKIGGEWAASIRRNFVCL